MEAFNKGQRTGTINLTQNRHQRNVGNSSLQEGFLNCRTFKNSIMHQIVHTHPKKITSKFKLT